MLHGIRGRKLERLAASRYFLLAERLPAYQGALRASLQVQAAHEQAANPAPRQVDHEPAQQQHEAPVTTTPIASDRLPTYTGEALAAMTDDGGMGFPGIEYDGG